MGEICAGENTQAGKIAELHSEWRGDRTILASERRSHAARANRNVPISCISQPSTLRCRGGKEFAVAVAVLPLGLDWARTLEKFPPDDGAFGVFKRKIPEEEGHLRAINNNTK